MQLTDSQKAAIAYVNARATGKPIDRALRITLNFHPDRAHEAVHILDSLAQGGVYRSQFETRTSNGGLTAHPGGDRWQWESRIFNGAYDNASPTERPKYGALNYKRDQYGASPRFGSAYLRLKQDVLERSTFCYPDSVFEPEAFGTSGRMALIDLAMADDKDLLDDYIEAQVHGELRIAQDVEALVLDPCYHGTDVETLANILNCPIEWHSGFVLTVEEMARYPDYRGQEFVDLGKDIAKAGVLTPKIIGDEAATGKYDSQALKRVWHYLARFGRK